MTLADLYEMSWLEEWILRLPKFGGPNELSS